MRSLSRGVHYPLAEGVDRVLIIDTLHACVTVVHASDAPEHTSDAIHLPVPDAVTDFELREFLHADGRFRKVHSAGFAVRRHEHNAAELDTALKRLNRAAGGLKRALAQLEDRPAADKELDKPAPAWIPS